MTNPSLGNRLAEELRSLMEERNNSEEHRKLRLLFRNWILSMDDKGCAHPERIPGHTGETPSLGTDEAPPPIKSLSFHEALEAIDADGAVLARAPEHDAWFRCARHPIYLHVIQFLSPLGTWTDIDRANLERLEFKRINESNAVGEDQTADAVTTSHLNAYGSPYTGESDLQGAAMAAAYEVTAESPIKSTRRRGADGLKEALKDPERWQAKDTFSPATMLTGWVPYAIWGNWVVGAADRYIFRPCGDPRFADLLPEGWAIEYDEDDAFGTLSSPDGESIEVSQHRAHQYDIQCVVAQRIFDLRKP